MKNILRLLIIALYLHPAALTAQQVARPKNSSPSVADSMYLFKDTVFGFRLLVPSKMVYTRPAGPHTDQQIIPRQYECRDDRENAIYLFGVNSLPEGLRISDDSIYYSSLKQELKEHFSVVDYDTSYRAGDYVVIHLLGKAKESNKFASIRYMVRGNRFYIQAAYYPAVSGGSARITNYFRSFSVLDLPVHPWQKTTTPDASFTTWTPAPLRVLPTDPSLLATGITKQYVSYDSIRANTFAIICSRPNPYYWSSSASALLKEKIMADFLEKDSLEYYKPIANGELKGWEWMKRLGHSNIYLRKRLLIDGDQFYYLIANGPPNEILTGDANRFFDDFQSARPPSTTHLFESKANVNAVLRNCIILVNDSSSFRFAADHYKALPASAETVKENLLEIMEHFRTEAHYKEMAALLLASPPRDLPFELFFGFGKNLHTTAVIMPQLLHFLDDTMARPFITNIVGSMLDSNLLTAAVIRPWQAAFLKYARHEIDELSTDYGSPRTFDDALMGVLGLINTPEANNDLREFFEMEFDKLRAKAFAALLRNGHQANADIQAMASNKATRMELYHILQKAGKQGLFPAAYLKQQLFGQSIVYNEVAGVYPEPPASIDFIASRTTGTGAGVKRFYFYACKETKDDRYPLLTCAGPYSADTKLVELPETKALINYSILYNPARAEEQMNRLMTSFSK